MSFRDYRSNRSKRQSPKVDDDLLLLPDSIADTALDLDSMRRDDQHRRTRAGVEHERVQALELSEEKCRESR